MSVSKGRDRRRDFEDLEGNTAIDFDPENDIDSQGDDVDSDLDDAADAAQSRDHYAKVEESKLRKSKEVALGPQYRGSKISRDAMLDDVDDEDDPFSKDFDQSDSDDLEMEDEASEQEQDDSEEELVDDDDDDDNSEAGTEDTSMSDEAAVQPTIIDKAEIRRAMANEKVVVSSAITSAQKADAEKGRAVLKQRATFDALLNARIKLQKSLIATNSLVALDSETLEDIRSDHDAAIAKAEVAAINLWTTLSQFRQELDGTKHSDATNASPQTLFKRIQAQEDNARSQRNATLQKWSMKSRSVNTTSQQSKLNNDQPTTIIDVLNEHLTSSDRLLKKARTPRSCAPVQLAKRVNEDEHIYDDADFYGMMLKELLDAKSSAASAAATNVDLTSFTNMRREAKTRKNVDTKASKGRKLRYTVHEKLQNYCAPEDRTTWGDRQVEELFTSLFGQQSNLNEEQQDEGDDVEMADAEAGLLLFKA